MTALLAFAESSPRSADQPQLHLDLAGADVAPDDVGPRLGRELAAERALQVGELDEQDRRLGVAERQAGPAGCPRRIAVTSRADWPRAAAAGSGPLLETRIAASDDRRGGAQQARRTGSDDGSCDASGLSCRARRRRPDLPGRQRPARRPAPRLAQQPDRADDRQAGHQDRARHAPLADRVDGEQLAVGQVHARTRSRPAPPAPRPSAPSSPCGTSSAPQQRDVAEQARAAPPGCPRASRTRRSAPCGSRARCCRPGRRRRSGRTPGSRRRRARAPPGRARRCAARGRSRAALGGERRVDLLADAGRGRQALAAVLRSPPVGPTQDRRRPGRRRSGWPASWPRRAPG